MQIDYTREKDILAALQAGKLKVIASGSQKHMMVTRRSNSRSTEVEHILGGTMWRVPNEKVTDEEPCLGKISHSCNSKCILFDMCRKMNGIPTDDSYLEHLEPEVEELEESQVSKELLDKAMTVLDPRGKLIQVLLGKDDKFYLFKEGYPTCAPARIATQILKKRGCDADINEPLQDLLLRLYSYLLLNIGASPKEENESIICESAPEAKEPALSVS